MSSDDRAWDWLEHIVENADRVAAYLDGVAFETFVASDLIRDAVERCIERITEAAVRLGPDRLAQLAPGTALYEVRGLGNVLRHEYDRINPRLIWKAATVDLPLLRTLSAAALASPREEWR